MSEITTEIIQKIKEFDTIIIHRHQRPDPDALGSQGGLGELIKTTFPEKKVLLAGAGVGDLDFLVTMDEVTKEDYENALAIIVDTANPPRIDGDLYPHAKSWLKIDHHPNNDPYGDICYVDTKASSCSEIITDMYLQHQDELKLSNAGARLLYAGIVGDTGRFMYPATTEKTFQVAAALRHFDFDAAELNRQIDQVPLKVGRLMGYVFNHLQTDENGATQVMLTKEIMAEYGVTDNDTPAIISLPGKIDVITSWVIFVPQEDNSYRVHFRSKGPVINELARKHDGGGHPLASGAKAKDLAEAKEIYRELQEIVKEYKNA